MCEILLKSFIKNLTFSQKLILVIPVRSKNLWFNDKGTGNEKRGGILKL